MKERTDMEFYLSRSLAKIKADRPTHTPYSVHDESHCMDKARFWGLLNIN